MTSDWPLLCFFPCLLLLVDLNSSVEAFIVSLCNVHLFMVTLRMKHETLTDVITKLQLFHEVTGRERKVRIIFTQKAASSDDDEVKAPSAKLD